MAITSLTVDVYCTRSEGSPIYRLYVDDDLLTERNWAWPAYETYVREHIEVDVGPGSHKIDFVDCSNNNIFYLKNITVNGQPNNGATFTV